LAYGEVKIINGIRQAVLQIRDVYPGSEFFPSRIPGQKIFGSRIRITEFKHFNPKNYFQTFGNMIRDVHPGPGSWFFLPIPDPGSMSQKGTGSRIRIRTTADRHVNGKNNSYEN
jgi:hypothetical protein